MNRERLLTCSLVGALFATVLASNVRAQEPRFHYLHGGTWHGMEFLDEDRGFVSADGGRIALSIDGGQTWTEVQTDDDSPESWVQLRGFHFHDPTALAVTGWAVGDGGVVLKTIEDTSGAEWTDANAQAASGTSSSWMTTVASTSPSSTTSS